MRFIILLIGFFATSACLAADANCAKYTAIFSKTGRPVTIVNSASDFVAGAGYTTFETELAGSITKSCETYFHADDDHACGIPVSSVRLVSQDDCWNFSSHPRRNIALRCQSSAKATVKAILEIQEGGKVVTTVLHSDRKEDDVGNIVETFEVRASDASGASIRSPLGLQFFIESDRCVLIRYSMPNAS